MAKKKKTKAVAILGRNEYVSTQFYFLKSGQNKKGKKHSLAAPFFESFLPAVRKDSRNGAARKFFEPSYFVAALIIILYNVWNIFLQYLFSRWFGKPNN